MAAAAAAPARQRTARQQARQQPAEPSRAAERLQQLPLAAHVAVLVLLVAVAAVVMKPTRSIATDDDALYGRQVIALRHGGWAWRGHDDDADPNGKWLPYQRGEVVDGKRFPYVNHPAYVVLLDGATSLFGLGYGILLLSMIGFVLSAVVAWLLANGIEPRAGPVAFWLVAFSPLLTNAYHTWAHTCSAALAGAALLVTVRIVRDGLRARRLAALAALTVAGALLRSEAVLFALALGLGLATTFLMRVREERRRWEADLQNRSARERRQGVVPPRPGRDRQRDAAAVLGVLVLVALATVAVEQRIINAIVHSGPAGRAALTSGPAGLRSRTSSGVHDLGQYVLDQLHGFWTIVFSPSYKAAITALPVIAAVVVGLCVVGFWQGVNRMRRPIVLFAVLSTAVAALYAWRFWSEAITVSPGFFAAWPVAFVGLFVVPWRRTSPAERALVAVMALFAVAVFATQYRQGGGAEWGGRFLSPVVVGVAALLGAGYRRRFATSPVRGAVRRGVAMLAATTAVFGGVGGLWAIGTWHHHAGPFLAELDTVATPTIAIVSDFDPIWHLTESAWRMEDEGHTFYRARVRNGQGFRMLEALYDAGHDDITLVLSPAMPEKLPYRMEDVTPPGLRAGGYRVYRLHR